MATESLRIRGSEIFTSTHTQGDAVIIRSTDAADTGTMGIYGLLTGGALDSAAVAAMGGAGKVERSSPAFDTVSHITLPSGTLGTVSIYSDDGIAAAGDIRLEAQPSASDTVSIGLTGFLTVYTFVASPTAANEVAIGADAAGSASNLAAAINLSGTDNVEYGAGTTANAYVSAVVAGEAVSITDRLSINRQLDWACAASTADFTIRQPIGGETGTRIARLSAGTTAVSTSSGLLFETDVTNDDSLPPTITGETMAANPRGRFTIWIAAGTIPGGDVALKYETSHDSDIWNDGGTALINLATDANQTITPPEHAEFVRLNITSNTLTGAIPLDARIVY